MKNSSKLGSGERNQWTLNLLCHVFIFFLLWGPYQIVFDNCIDYIFKVTKSVIEDFEQDNVKYLELRSTPRANPETGIGIQ